MLNNGGSDAPNPFTKIFLNLHQQQRMVGSPSLPAAAAGSSRGEALIHSANANHGTSFSDSARSTLAITGLVPPAVESLDAQVARSISLLREIDAPIQQYMYLDRIRSENSVLFYRLVIEYLQETVKIIYTPTVGLACQRFSHIYTPGNTQGLFLSLAHKDRLDQVLDSWTASGRPDPQICVMTDGSRILGLGDLGVNGMGIPIGKLSLYIAAAGFDPARTLPVTLDLGTNTDSIRDDPFYLGTRMKRPDDATFFGFLDAVMRAFARKWPKMLVQFEDFSSEHAFQTLERYRNQYSCFNDDIQGTGAVILSGFINAVRESNVPLENHRILFLGAGSAGVGVACQLCTHFMKAIPGMTEREAKSKFYLMDSKGLITTDRVDASRYPDHKKILARDDMHGVQIVTLIDAIRRLRPTVLIGLSSQGGVFTEEIIRTMGEFNQRPIIFPLSNPIQNAECTFADAMRHTHGRVLFASGTAFPPELHPVTRRTVIPGQGNNFYVFPGIGNAGRWCSIVSDDMVYQSAATLAATLDSSEIREGMLYPRIERIREISAIISRDVVLAGLREGLVQETDILGMFGARFGQPCRVSDTMDRMKQERLLQWIAERMWEPTYDRGVGGGINGGSGYGYKI
ncbi:hypothetical protein HDU67_002045 [Dinochytrium kinnereticum]|nr:hypothetical protein HDU67_002045 [Dinochytrium kinnereticum]